MRIIKTPVNNQKAKLFYLSGYAQEGDGTFDALFSKSTLKQNFKELFYDRNIETHACEYDTSDTHFEVFNKAREYVIKNQIDFVFGFCYGSFPGLHCAVKTNVKGVILLDSSTKVPDWSETGITKNLTKPIPMIMMPHINCPVKLFYSEWGASNKIETEKRLKTEYIKNIDIEIIKDSTHAIMLEPQRFTLMNKIMEFIDAQLPSLEKR